MSCNYGLEDFVVGPSNQFAYEAIQDVMQYPNALCNVLYLYGPSGVGKTHLIFQTFCKMRNDNPDLRVIYLTAEELANGVVNAHQSLRIDEFREYYHHADLLFADDLQKLAGMEATTEVFEFLFDQIQRLGGKIIITADCHPRDIPGICNRLRQRLCSSIAIRMDLPEKQTREEIVRRRAVALGNGLSDDLYGLVAEITENAFQIEGVVRKLLLWEATMQETLDLKTAAEILEDEVLLSGDGI